MRYQTIIRGAAMGLLIAAATATFSQNSQASDMIPSGFDIFDPLLGSTIFAFGRNIPVVGVPLGSYGFPGFGDTSTGNGDSIVYRAGKLTACLDHQPGCVVNLSTDIAFEAMQMRSVDGSDLFFTLDTGTPSVGTMNMIFGPEPHDKCLLPLEANDSCFTWDINVFLDVRAGSLGGPILSTVDLLLTVGPTVWGHTPPPGAVLIPGVNYQLAGLGDTDGDFFPGPFEADGILFSPATVGEPETLTLLAVGLAGIAAVRRKRSVTLP